MPTPSAPRAKEAQTTLCGATLLTLWNRSSLPSSHRVYCGKGGICSCTCTWRAHLAPTAHRHTSCAPCAARHLARPALSRRRARSVLRSLQDLNSTPWRCAVHQTHSHAGRGPCTSKRAALLHATTHHPYLFAFASSVVPSTAPAVQPIRRTRRRCNSQLFCPTELPCATHSTSNLCHTLTVKPTYHPPTGRGGPAVG